MTEATIEPQERPSLKDVYVIDIGDNEGKGTTSQLDAIVKEKPEGKQKALILVGEVSGATPYALNPKIQELVGRRVSVFIVGKGYGKGSGIHEIRYNTQKKASEAGAIHLQNANLNNFMEVASCRAKSY